MKYALERLDKLICYSLNPDIIGELEISNNQFERWINDSKLEIGNIRTFLMRRSCELEKSESIQLLIQQYQAHIVRLMDRLHDYIGSSSRNSINRVYISILGLLKILLEYFERQYGGYFNYQEMVPIIYLEQANEELKKNIRRLKKKLSGIIEDDLFIRIVLTPMHAFSNINDQVSFQRLKYVKNLLTDMISFCNNITKGEGAPKLVEFLVLMNFNSLSFFNYMINNMNERVNSYSEVSNKIKFLADNLKMLNQQYIDPNIALIHESDTLKQQLTAWITEEIYFLERQQGLRLVPAEVPSPAAEDEQLVHVNLSVDALSLLIRAAKDAGMIMNRNQTALLKIIARMFRTPYAEHISPESLRVKYYVAERRAKETIQNLLHEMLKQVHKYCWIPLVLHLDFFSFLI